MADFLSPPFLKRFQFLLFSNKTVTFVAIYPKQLFIVSCLTSLFSKRVRSLEELWIYFNCGKCLAVKWLFSCLSKWAECGAKTGFRVMLKDFEVKKAFLCSSLFRYYIKQIDSMLPCVCSVIDRRRCRNVVRISVTHSAIASCATFLFLPHFDVICDLLLNRVQKEEISERRKAGRPSKTNPPFSAS